MLYVKKIISVKKSSSLFLNLSLLILCHILLNVLLLKNKVFSLHSYDSVKCMIYGYQISTIGYFFCFFFCLFFFPFLIKKKKSFVLPV